jgi:hypothetical protein
LYVVQKFKADRVKTRILPENGLVQSGFAGSASLRSLKMGQNSPKTWNGFSLGSSFHTVWTQSSPRRGSRDICEYQVDGVEKPPVLDGENDSVVQGAHG